MRFDNEASTIKESKKVYKSVLDGLTNKTNTIKETVGNKLSGEPKTSSKSQINESTAYVDESTKRMLDLMNKVNKR